MAQPHLALAGAAPAVGYRLDTFGAHAAVLSVEAPHERLATALSADGTTFKIHLAEGVFLDHSPFRPAAGSSITAINQLRGDVGVQLVLSVQPGTIVTSRAGPDRVRYIFAAATAEEAVRSADPVASGSPELECAAERHKIAELQELVRKLTLEVLSLKQRGATAQRTSGVGVKDPEEKAREE